ncbi:DUF2184 domain-containing protein [Pseudomonas brenneri]|uniref:major capsid family protein n=1 Tax=Pseudomonas brenneri TaxID=129817 RepID=UPI0025A0C808|nr:major capsid family protein [Pseudomonas brenneri]WJM94068.1 DUF2184 domain-containing protein [Pseudomonas brenneri]
MAREVKLADGSTATLNDHFERLVDSDVKLSDGDGVFFQRQLEVIEQTTYDVLYPDLEARDCFPTLTLGGAGATSLTYRSYDRVGKAQVINARATDLPKSDISGREYSINVKSVGCAYDFDIDEVASANMSGMPLEARKAMASRRGYEQYVNDAVWSGDANGGFVGLFGNPYIAHNPVVAGAGGGTTWLTKTPDEKLKDLFSACSAMYAATKKIHKPEEIWLPVLQWNDIANTPRSAMSDTTILDFFVANNQFGITKDKVKALNAIDNKFDGGADGFVVISKKTPEGTQTVRIREPLPLQFLPVQLHGLVYEVPGRGRFAGLEVTYPRAIDLWYGI